MDEKCAKKILDEILPNLCSLDKEMSLLNEKSIPTEQLIQAINTLAEICQKDDQLRKSILFSIQKLSEEENYKIEDDLDILSHNIEQCIGAINHYFDMDQVVKRFTQNTWTGPTLNDLFVVMRFVINNKQPSDDIWKILAPLRNTFSHSHPSDMGMRRKDFMALDILAALVYCVYSIQKFDSSRSGYNNHGQRKFNQGNKKSKDQGKQNWEHRGKADSNNQEYKDSKDQGKRTWEHRGKADSNNQEYKDSKDQGKRNWEHRGKADSNNQGNKKSKDQGKRTREHRGKADSNDQGKKDSNNQEKKVSGKVNPQSSKDPNHDQVAQNNGGNFNDEVKKMQKYEFFDFKPIPIVSKKDAEDIVDRLNSEL